MEITNVDTAEFWNREAARFDEEADHGLKDPGVRGAWLDLLSGVLPPPPARVADLGCGTGTLSLLLAQRGYRVDGIDLSERMIERAEAKAASVDPGPRFEVADAAEPPLHPATFDVVLSRHVVWALADPAAALRRWVRLLVPGGRLVLIEGRWATGAGLGAAQAKALVAPIADVTAVHELTDPVLWGKEVSDERFLLVAQVIQ